MRAGQQEMVQVGERRDPDLVTSVVRRWRLVVAVTCLGAAAGFLGSLAMPRVYEAHTSLVVGQFGAGDVTINDIKAIQSMAATYADLARREPVMRAVVTDLGLHMSWRQLVKDVHTKIPREDPQVIDITVEAASPGRAEKMAASVAAHVISVVGAGGSTGSKFLQTQLTAMQSDIESIGRRLTALREELGSNTVNPTLQREVADLHAQLARDQQNYATFRAIFSPASSAQVSLLDSAHASSQPVRPNVRFNTIIVGFGGLVIGVALAYLLAARGHKVRDGGRRADVGEPDGKTSLVGAVGSSA